MQSLNIKRLLLNICVLTAFIGVSLGLLPLVGWQPSHLTGELLAESATAALSPVAADPVELQVWAMGAEGKLLRKMAERFEAGNPDVRVRIQAIPWDGAHEKLVTGVIGGMAPDVCQMGTTWMPEFTAMDSLEPLDSWLSTGASVIPVSTVAGSAKAEMGVVNLADFFPESLATARFENRLFGLPWYVDTRVFFYRTDLLAAVGVATFPTNWPELKRTAEAVRDGLKSRGEPGYALSIPPNDWQILLMFFWQAGGELLASPTSPFMTPAAAGAALEYLKSLFQTGIAPLAAGKDMDLLSAFDSGYYTAFISGPYMISNLEIQKPAMKGLWATAPMPGRDRSGSFLGGCNLVMFKSSTHKPEAWRFMSWLSQPAIQAEWYDLAKSLPSRRSAWDLPALSGTPHLKAFRTQLDSARACPAISCWEQVAQMTQGSMEEVMYNKTDVETAVTHINLEAALLLGRNRSLQPFWMKGVLLGAVLFFTLGGLLLWFQYGPKSPLGGAQQSGSSRFDPAVIWFILPALAGLIIFLFVPIVWSFAASLTNWDMYGIAAPDHVRVVGLDNYWKLLNDPVFWLSLRNTILFAAAAVPLNLLVALGLALVLNRSFIRAIALFRIGFFIPVITTMVAVAVIWRWLYNPEFGLLNIGLGFLGLPPLNWLSNEWLALPSLIFMAVWKGFGYNMVIFIAALQAIPGCLYEAAEIDGATELQQFKHITLPLLNKTLGFVSLMTTIGYLQFFAEPYVMTSGGPLNQTMSVVLYMYGHGFRFYNLGYASSIAWTLSAVILTATWLQGRLRARLEGARK
ncbi:MAG: extracellular solute-binding protein [Candidatus Ozemobacteraceae bacterium]